MPDVSQIAGIVLVGGRSSRMGRDKAFLELIQFLCQKNLKMT